MVVLGGEWGKEGDRASSPPRVGTGGVEVLFEAPSPLARGSRGDWFIGRYSSGLVSDDHYADVWAHGCFSSRVGKPVCKNDFIESLIKMSLITTGRYSDGEVKDLVAPG